MKMILFIVYDKHDQVVFLQTYMASFNKNLVKGLLKYNTVSEK